MKTLSELTNSRCSWSGVRFFPVLICALILTAISAAAVQKIYAADAAQEHQSSEPVANTGSGQIVVPKPNSSPNIPPHARAFGDLNNDGSVGFPDFLFLLEYWGVEFDGAMIGFKDFMALIENWGVVVEFTIRLPREVPLVMVRVPSGSFVMGSPEGERGRFDTEGPQTTVLLTRDYYVGKYPVTQNQWLSLMVWPGTEPSSEFGKGPHHPAYWISWYDAQSFITALNTHITATGQGPLTVRLPSEAEWEYAARAGTTTRFFFGDSLGCDDFEADCAAGVLPGNRSDYMWWLGNSGGQCRPVGQKLPNRFGLHDMHGNIWEWVHDWYADSLPGGSVTDPAGPGTGTLRVARGGSWGHQARNCRAARRFSNSPDTRPLIYGFRLAADT